MILVQFIESTFDCPYCGHKNPVLGLGIQKGGTQSTNIAFCEPENEGGCGREIILTAKVKTEVSFTPKTIHQ